MYSIVNIYYELYMKKPISREDLITTYGPVIRRAVARYNDIVSTMLYTNSRSYKHIQ